MTRVEAQASVCSIEDGLLKEDILLLYMLRVTSQETCTKILQFFVERDPSVSALKVYADNIRSSEVKLTGSVNIVKGQLNKKNVKPKDKAKLKCSKCGKEGHEVGTCRVRVCDHCYEPGHTKAQCYTNPESSSFKGIANVTVGNYSGVSPAVNQVSGTTLGQTSTNAPLIAPDGHSS